MRLIITSFEPLATPIVKLEKEKSETKDDIKKISPVKIPKCYEILTMVYYGIEPITSLKFV